MAADSLKRLPFDYYGRYRLAAEVVQATTGPDAAVLDVGGGPGALSAFVDRSTVVSCDLRVETDQRVAASTLVLGDAARLPFSDDAFDVVVSLDTLEHIPAEARREVLHEAARVARGWVLFVCPCETDGVTEADSAMLAYLRHRFGEDFPSVRVLTEHLVYGHPDPDQVLEGLRETGGEAASFPSGRLDHWVPMMFLFYELMALGRDDPVERVQAWYNPRYWREDLRAPSYRQAFLLRLPAAQGPPLEAVVRGLLPGEEEPRRDADAFEALDRTLRDPLLAEVQSLRASVDTLHSALDEARVRLAEQGERLRSAQAEVAALSAFRERVLAHPAVRVRSALRRRR